MGCNVTSLCFAIVAALAGAPPAPPDSPLVEDAKLQSAGMHRYWQTRLPVAKGDALLRGHLVDEVLYVIAGSGNVFAIQADVGLIRWGVKLTEPDYRIWAPTHVRTSDGAGPVILPTPNRVFIVDRFSGDLIQSFVPQFGAAGPVAAYDDNLFLGGEDGRFYSLRLVHASAAVEPFKRWEVLAGGPVTGAPSLYDDDKLLFGSQGGAVYSCYASDKALNWGFKAGGPVAGDPVVDESGVYVASADRSLYKLRRDDGNMVWRVRLPRPLTEGPLVTAGTVFQYCAQHGLVAIDASSGQERWRHQNGRAFVAHGLGGDVIFTEDKRLLVLDHATGDVQSGFDVQAVTKTVPNTRDDAVYLLGSDGRVLCARLDAAPYLRRQQVTAARRRLNLPPEQTGVAAEQPGKQAGEQLGPTSSDPLRSPRDRKP
jgi:outer membrane protein assembly factor BamB